MKALKLLAICFMIIIINHPVAGQRNVYHGEKEVIPVIPPKDQRLRTIIVSDVTNEIDDVWAIALAILYPERFDIEGIVESNYDHIHLGLGPKSIEMSVKEAHTILEKAGMKGKCPIYPGGDPMQYEFHPSGSEGIDFIIERAMAGSPDNPLWIISLGNPTDAALAYLKEPAIKDGVIMFCHARTENTWPDRAHNYSIKGDIHASRMMFHSPLPLVLFDTGTYLSAGTLEESEKYVKPYGDLGEYLYNYRLKSTYWSGTRKGFFDLGDIAALIDPDIATWEVITAPTVTNYMDYNWNSTNGKLIRCSYKDRDKTFQLLYDGLKRHYGNN